jgi:hypothetical protein
MPFGPRATRGCCGRATIRAPAERIRSEEAGSLQLIELPQCHGALPRGTIGFRAGWPGFRLPSGRLARPAHHARVF